MKNLKLIVGTIAICLFLTSCDKKSDTQPLTCDQQVIVSELEYTTAPSDQLSITSVELNDNCLKIKFGSSGCSGDTWEVKLIDSGVILYSNPPQRNLRLSLKNQEICSAYIGKEMTFDVKNLQSSGNKVLLNIVNSGTQILYEY